MAAPRRFRSERLLKIYMGRNRLLPGALVEVLRTAPEEIPESSQEII